MTYLAQWIPRIAFVILASSWFSIAAAVNDASGDLAGDADATGNSSQRIAPADF